FYHPRFRRVLSSHDITFDESVFFYRLHPHRSSPVPLPPLALVSDPSPIAPLPPQVLLPQFYHPRFRRVLSSHDITFDESVFFYRLHPHRSPAPSGVSQVDPSPLVEPVKVSSDTSGPAEGGDLTPATTVTPRRSARLAVPLGFPPRPSSPPLQPVAMDSGAVGGGATGGADSWGAGSGGAGAGGPGTSQQEALSPEQLHECAV
ncbi:unnamed protein product, partial [Closterium sp. NIES-53]